jgi:hypothetical protein
VQVAVVVVEACAAGVDEAALLRSVQSGLVDTQRFSRVDCVDGSESDPWVVKASVTQRADAPGEVLELRLSLVTPKGDVEDYHGDFLTDGTGGLHDLACDLALRFGTNERYRVVCGRTHPDADPQRVMGLANQAVQNGDPKSLRDAAAHLLKSFRRVGQVQILSIAGDLLSMALDPALAADVIGGELDSIGDAAQRLSITCIGLGHTAAAQLGVRAFVGHVLSATYLLESGSFDRAALHFSALDQVGLPSPTTVPEIAALANGNAAALARSWMPYLGPRLQLAGLGLLLHEMIAQPASLDASRASFLQNPDRPYVTAYLEHALGPEGYAELQRALLEAVSEADVARRTVERALAATGLG